jgi:hypothetical protein
MALRFLQRLPDGRNDVRVSAAAADIARHGLADLVVGFSVAFVDQSNCRTDLTGSAVAALKSVVFDEGGLHRVELAPGCQTFDGGDLIVLVHDGQREAGVDPLAIDEHGAGATLAVIATLLSAAKANVFT